MSRLIELVEKCQAATGPDRELDRDIELAIFPNRLSPCPTVELLAYTGSMDAAMTLVPADGMANFTLSRSSMSVDMGGRNWRCAVGWKARASGRTHALAICSAALTARTLSQGGKK